ncbi:DUF2924 domain-containing protein [Azospirillum doebereinerae]|uniref:DUF2924 domain-containing protein n=1 Tax=Azospirillum doebereinerae TaxID=92933 RepID=A0A433JC12_9PROT|nr:DUF2924 domain-containing protein [Azospirillum doebereinerae]RUQ74021.1 DUF2924 domain-containing protein [Azospirillum doebereinerae]
MAKVTPLSTEAIDTLLASLPTLSLDELRREWKHHLHSPPPAGRSRELLRGLIAWKLQDAAFGGLSPDAKRRLVRLADSLERRPGHSPPPKPTLRPGTVLTREWRGVLHQVRVTADGFEHLGTRFASLSEVARAITGTRWSGPAFFGLTAPTSRKAKP